jgi:hypothetical protein
VVGGENLNKRILAAVLIFFMVGLSVGWVVKTEYLHMDPSYNVHFEFYKTDSSGAEGVLAVGNLITDIGENFIGNATIGLENNGTWSISVSNVGSPLASWTQLDTEVNANGFTRKAATTVVWVNGGDWAVNYTATFTATATQQLQTAGLQWDSTPASNNNLFAAATFTQTTFNYGDLGGDSLTCRWTITHNAN